MTLTGIKAKYAGKCPLCNEPWDEGDLIEKIPGEENARGHAECVAEHKTVHGSARRPVAAPTTQNGHGNGATVTPIRKADPELAQFATAEAYWEARDAMTSFARAAMQAANAFEKLAKQIDPNHVKEHTRS